MKKTILGRNVAVALYLFVSAVMGMTTYNAIAGLQYWDPGGATVNLDATGTWETSKWNTGYTASGTLAAWTEGNAVVFSCTNASSGLILHNYTVVLNSNHTIAGLFNSTLNTSSTTNLQISGTGKLIVAAGDQGFDTTDGTNGNTTINVGLAGAGNPQTQGSGSFYFYGDNSGLTGKIELNATGGLNFNNNNSFGTGLITNMTTASTLATPLTDGGGNATGATNAITIANAMWAYNNTAAANDSTITIVGNASAPITWTGAWHMNAPNTNTLTLDTRSGTLTISGVISGAENLKKINTTGTLVLSGANTYSGKTTIGGPVSVSSLNKVTGGSASSSLGHPTTAPNGTIAIGVTSTGGTLIYTGSGETTDRVIDLSGTTGGATIQADGTGNLVFTAVNTATGAGAKTLTLTGSGATTNSIGKVVDSSSATSLSKTGNTTWTLAAANTYSGTTSVSAGKLQLGNAASLGTNTLTWSSASIDNITGSDLTLANNITVGGNPTYVGSANALTFTGTATLSGNRTITVTANTLALGALAETTGGDRNFAKSGNGTLVVNGVCTYTGTTTVNSGGTLRIANAGQLMSGNATNTVSVSGTLDYSSSAAQTFSAAVTGSGSILVDGTGALTFAGAAPAFTGTITVNSSSLIAGANNCFPTGATVNLNGGTINMGLNNATVKALKYAGISKPAGTYGSIGSGAQHENAQFAGTGILTVTSGATSATTVTSDNQSATVGQTVTFTVTVTGNGGDGSTPTGTVTIYDNGTAIGAASLSGSGNVASGTFATSALAYGTHPITASWNGNDSYGASTSAAYNQFVVQAPVITSPSTSSTVVADAGTNVSLSVTLQDANGVTYQWKRGGVDLSNGANDNAATIAGSTAATLTLIGVKAADAAQGDYSCVALNAAGSTTSPAFTLVVNDPAISVQPTNSTFECGSNGCLSVTAAGTTNSAGLLLYQWYSAGNPIANATNSSLCFSPAHFSDAGSYSVIVSNAFGNSVTSQVAVVTVQDTTGPVVTINGLADMTVECHGSFSDPGATATDACQGTSTIASATGGSLNLNVVGDYTLSYTASDSFSNPGNVATRVVHVRDTTAPGVVLTGAASISVECHTSFTDPGATATDACDANPTVSTSGSVDVNTAGTYTLTYTATDASGNHSSATRLVVVGDSTAPVVTLSGASSVTVECHGAFSDPGASALDSCSGSVNVTTSGTVNLNAVGTYTRTYTATDPSNNSGTATRVIHVTDTTGPSLVGVPADTTAECSSIPTAATVTATDTCDANPNVSLSETTIAGSCAQSYTLVRTWTATDGSGNTATAAQHITVQDTTAPVLTLTGGASVTAECHAAFVDPGVSANDACAGNVSVSTTGSVDANTVGDYTLTYSAVDPCGNTGTATRVVHVSDTTAPLISLNPGSSTASWHGAYSDPGATASDSCSGSVTLATNGVVDTSALGAYTLTYTATDDSGNSSTTNRVVEVINDGTPVAINSVTVTGAIVSIPDGTNVQFTVSSSGSDPKDYKWYVKDVGNAGAGTLVLDTTSPTASISAVAVNRAASGRTPMATNVYYVVVDNWLNQPQTSGPINVSIVVDKTKPSLILSAPINNARAQTFVVKGVAQDLHGNAAVLKYFWTGVSTPNVGPTRTIDLSHVGTDSTKRDFSAGITLENPPTSGANQLTIWVDDLAGNQSSPAKVVKVFYQVPHIYALTIAGDGTGSLKVTTKGAPHETIAGVPTAVLVGSSHATYNLSLYDHQYYSFKYTPDPKAGKPDANLSVASVVSNALPTQVAGADTTRPVTVSFTAGSSDTSATVFFNRNRLVDMAGSYNAVFTGTPDSPTMASTYYLNLTVASTGKASGYLLRGDSPKARLSFTKVQFGPDGSASFVADNNTLTISGSLAWTGSENANNVKQFIGTATKGWVASVVAEKGDKTVMSTPGLATMVIPAVSGVPGGAGFAVLKLNNGSLIGTYKLADDDKHPAVWTLVGSHSGTVPQFVGTHSGGLLFGNVVIANGLTAVSATGLTWIAPAVNQTYATYLPGGFTHIFDAITSSYSGDSFLSGNYHVSLSGGGLAADINQVVNFAAGASTAASGPIKSAKLKNGALSVVFLDGSSKTHTTTAYGTVLQNTVNGAGFFIKGTAPADAGNLILTPIP